MSSEQRSTIYARGRDALARVHDASAKRKWKSTGLRIGQEKEAQKLLEAINRRAQAEAELVAKLPAEAPSKGPLTVGTYRAHWIAERRKNGVGSADDDEARLRHAEDLMPLLVSEVRPRHARNLIRKLKATGTLAPRTIRHVHGVLHRMFEDMVVDELIEANPIALKRGELPKKKDKDPTWRGRRPSPRTSSSATGRIGEWGARTFAHIDRTLRPQPGLLIATSFNRKKKRIKDVKS